MGRVGRSAGVTGRDRLAGLAEGWDAQISIARRGGAARPLCSVCVKWKIRKTLRDTLRWRGECVCLTTFYVEVLRLNKQSLRFFYFIV